MYYMYFKDIKLKHKFISVFYPGYPNRGVGRQVTTQEDKQKAQKKTQS